MANRIPLDPKLPVNFHNTPNGNRSKKQLDEWWDHPYGLIQEDGSIMVLCLNGGSWDRPSLLGVAENHDEACELAEKEQRNWVKTREQPIFRYSTNPPFELIRDSQRPDEEQVIVASFDTLEELHQYLSQGD
ncbi:DNA-binding protein [Klebsiella michiganensis]|jgi:hypothetical protein|uniref:DNA-binding protein n=1 Tax=Klebsiella/Raoultella group TaxID=2890311 RepID=UPI00092DA71A|nr:MULTISPECIES: DNA-binding protein [Klebsiella/Raoultella group]APM29169.1 DNA-binding protein [Klebsiella oxytoca]UVY41789.1 MAG: hypothetical protein [Bacteriophage sp.]EKX4892421.1 DNA-binding protein [Raoultella ornithinolytica]MBM7228114.1 DNA-binding protein [Klebsiella michiganensis]MTF12913.1 DNA-binding protein [Raoultella ornithinolytica]